MSDTPSDHKNVLCGLSNKDIYKRATISMASCELIGMAVAAAGVVHHDKILPNQVKKIKDVLARKVIQPHLNLFEPAYDMIMKSKGKEHNKLDKYEDTIEDPVELKSKKAHEIANALVKFGLPAGLGILATVPSHYFLDKKLDIVQDNRNVYGSIRFFESAVQIGAFAAVNTVGNSAVEATVPLGVKILTKFGVSEDTARAFTQFGIRYELANAFALGAAIWRIGKKLIETRDRPGVC